jgi:hypothetical protein
MMNEPTPPNPPEPIPSELARDILYRAIRERLGEDWDDPETGWTMVTGHDFMARLTRNAHNIDFYVDLLGEVRIEESRGNAALATGRLLLWMLLALSIVIALLIVRISGG